MSRVLLYSSNSNGVFVGRVSRAYVQHFMMPGACYVPDAYDTRYALYTACMSPTGSRGSQGHCFTMSYVGWIAGFSVDFSSAAVDVDALTKLVF